MHTENPSWTKLFDEAVQLHERGVSGDKEAVKKAYELLTTVRNSVPNNKLVQAYYGSVTTLLGRDAIDPIERVQHVNTGLKLLDQAVSNDPKNIEIRILRAYVCLRLPEMYFHRTSTAVEDFKYLLSRYEKDSSLFSKSFYWQLFYDLGVAYKNLGETHKAKSTWQKLLSQTTDPKYQELLRQEGI